VAWIVKLVSVGAEGEEHSTEVMQIARPEDLTDLASLGLTLAEGKQLLAGVQREIVAAQARVHAVRRPACRGCGDVCRVKDYRHHAVATLFGQVMVRLLRLRCARCGATETGVAWPSYIRSTPELDRLRAQLAALMPYRTAAEVLAQMFPVDAGIDPETLRRHTFKVAENLPMPATAKPTTPAEAIVVTLDSTFIRSCEEGERHRAGLRVGTALTEGTANFLVNRRMAKSQRMRWSQRGADQLLQVRCALYNGTLGTGLWQRFHAANDALPPVAAAA
jgi:hypothetical protein